MFVPFEPEFRKRYYALLEQIFDSGFWSEGPMIRKFEEKWEETFSIGARAVSNGGTALLAILDYIDVRGKDVVVPANTFWATAQSVKKAGGNVIYADSNRDDLCMSLEDLKKKITPNTKAVILVHIGGHIAFQAEEIAAFCKEKGLTLLEDCAHVHGSRWKGKVGGGFGFAGAYSFYATKTMPTGDGGMIVSHDRAFLEWVSKYRNYGKEVFNKTIVTYPIKNGFNFRMNEFTAALGIVQLERLPRVLEWKHMVAAKYDQIFAECDRVRLPEGMVSGYYKYIVFNQPKLKQVTGQVFGPNDLGHRIEKVSATVPNAEWITENHQCPPIWYGWEHANKSAAEIREILGV